MDINTGGIADSFANFVWEPAVVKVTVYLQFLDNREYHICFDIYGVA